ncbi:MAG: hypothetical protein ABJA78_13410 [Ferruginibacter sp.]
MYGKWNFITNYEGKITDINKVKNDTFKWKGMTVYMTFNKNGEYFYREDDMIEEKNFAFNPPDCTLKLFLKNADWKKDTATLEVAYLDNEYLLYNEKYKSGYFTYLYKKQ